MRFVGWLFLGVLLGPSFFGLAYPSWMVPVAQLAGGIFMFLAGWEMRFLDISKDRRFYGWAFLGAFIFPVLIGWFVFQGHLFLALSMGISALPVAIQLLKEKGLYDSPLGRRVLTVASLCDLIPWIAIIFLLPKENMVSWIVSHWVVMTFFVGLLAGRFKAYPKSAQLTSVQSWVLAPLFFIGLGWKIDIVSLFSLHVFLLLLITAIFSKGLGAYVASRVSGESHGFSLDFATLLNARGAMEVIAAHFAYTGGLINGAQFAGLVLVGIVTSLIAVPSVKSARTLKSSVH